MNERAQRLMARFDLIQQSLSELHGPQVAFAAVTAAWLMAIQYWQHQSLLRMRDAAEQLPSLQRHASLTSLATDLDDENQIMLQGFHAELCKYLGVEEHVALRLSKSFQQVIRDICQQGG